MVLFTFEFEPGPCDFDDQSETASHASPNFYYDDLATYTRFQKLKEKIDPENLFHSRLTVELP